MSELPFTKKAREYIDDPVNWRGCSPDNPPCAICKNPIIECIPIRLFKELENVEIAFHVECAFGDCMDDCKPEEPLASDEMDIQCFYCEKLEKCNFISANYKGQPKKRKGR